MRSRQPGPRGQASLEVVGLAPAVMIAGLVAFQILAAGYAAAMADHAAEAGALALAAGTDPRSAARRAVPGWARARMHVAASGERVTVTIRPPGPLESASRRLALSATAFARGPSPAGP